MSPEDQARNEAVVAAPGTVVLGGRTFVCKPDNVKAMFALRVELRKQIQARMTAPIEAVNRRVSEAERSGKPLSPTVVKYLVEAALSADAAGAKIEPSIDQITEQSTTPEGSRWLSWWVIHQADKTITLDWVKEKTPTDDEIFDLAIQVAEVMRLAKLIPK